MSANAVRSAALSVYPFYIIDNNLALSVLLKYDEEGLPGKIWPAHESITEYAAALGFAISALLHLVLYRKLESACIPASRVCYTIAKLFQYLLLQIIVWELRSAMMSSASPICYPP